MSAFKISMVYAPTRKLIKHAAEGGANWGVGDSYGPGRDRATSDQDYRSRTKMAEQFGVYNPDRELPKFIDLMKDEDATFIYKATWADVSLRQPPNPWIG